MCEKSRRKTRAIVTQQGTKIARIHKTKLIQNNFKLRNLRR